MHYENLRCELDAGLARVTLSRPDVANAIDLQTAKDLMYVALRCDEDRAVRAVLVTGAGSFFCSGGDLASFSEAKADGMPELIKEITTYLHAAISRFARMRAPVVMAVNGTAAGAGLSLACAGDLAIACESARFTMAYTRVGLAPDGSSTYYLPRLIGTRRTLELALTNRVLTAQEALDWGIVNRVVADDALADESLAVARDLASGATEAFGMTKRLVLTGHAESLEAQMELETRAIADAARTADAREGVEAFLAKRRPAFRGE